MMNCSRNKKLRKALNQQGGLLIRKLVDLWSFQAADQFCVPARSASFNHWFAGSQVVDALGNPLTVYHGTNHAFTNFQMTNEIGVHFGSLPQALQVSAERLSARGGERIVMPVWVAIKHPLEVSDIGTWTPDKVLDEVRRREYLPDRVGEALAFLFRTELKGDEQAQRAALIAALESVGCDGLVYENNFEGGGGKSFIAFHPNQVKSVYNEGPFSPHSDNILR